LSLACRVIEEGAADDDEDDDGAGANVDVVRAALIDERRFRYRPSSLKSLPARYPSSPSLESGLTFLNGNAPKKACSPTFNNGSSIPVRKTL
jgi:hypothetical protein